MEAHSLDERHRKRVRRGATEAYKTKAMGTSTTTLAMAFKLIKEAEKGWRKITRRQQLELVRGGRVFKDGELVTKDSAA